MICDVQHFYNSRCFKRGLKLIDSAQELDLGRWTVSQEFVNGYLEAVGDGSSLYAKVEAAPALAVAAQVLTMLLEKMSLPPGSVHTAQELSCQGPIGVGQAVTGSAKWPRPAKRDQWRFISADFVVRAEGGQVLLRGRTSVMAPDKT